jgi:hypothetical protein
LYLIDFIIFTGNTIIQLIRWNAGTLFEMFYRHCLDPDAVMHWPVFRSCSLRPEEQRQTL